jgi:hypothetical protein
MRRVPDYELRLAVLPGITGLAQVQFPSDTGLESVKRKLQADLTYIRSGCASLDTRILLCTGLRLAGMSNIRAYEFAGLYRIEIGDSTSNVAKRAEPVRFFFAVSDSARGSTEDLTWSDA